MNVFYRLELAWVIASTVELHFWELEKFRRYSTNHSRVKDGLYLYPMILMEQNDQMFIKENEPH